MRTLKDMIDPLVWIAGILIIVLCWSAFLPQKADAGFGGTWSFGPWATGQWLVDPAADAIGIWDDSAGKMDWAKDVSSSEDGHIKLGTDGGTQGKISMWHGSGGNQPGYIVLVSPNGTASYFFVEDDGTFKRHTSEPTANTDGTVVGSQS